MAEKFRAMRGTHDILPEEAHIWRRIEDYFAGICGRYGYSEIRIPIFEATQLFERGTGFATDVVQKEMYTFPDKKGRSLTLRPEATPAVIRAFLEHSLGRRGKVTKLFYMGPMFRYDRPGQGRYRQFHQLGIEAIGTASAVADAEVIRLLWDYLRGIGLATLRVRLNTLGCKECRIKYSDVLKIFLESRLDKLCADCNDRFARNPLRVLDCKTKSCRVLIEEAPDVATVLCEDDIEHFDRVKTYLSLAGVDFYVDSKLVRGLDYYTRTVFEVVHESAGEDLALGGGGRYDELVQVFGGPSTPAVGFSLGLERVVAALGADRGGGEGGSGESRDAGAVTGTGVGPDVYVANLGDEASDKAFELAGILRGKLKVWLEFDQRKLDRQLKSASKLGAKYTAIIGSDELAQGVVRMKDMASGEQTMVRFDETLDWLTDKVGG
jgi:histidyl-tRNA synthetase